MAISTPFRRLVAAVLVVVAIACGAWLAWPPHDATSPPRSESNTSSPQSTATLKVLGRLSESSLADLRGVETEFDVDTLRHRVGYLALLPGDGSKRDEWTAQLDRVGAALAQGRGTAELRIIGVVPNESSRQDGSRANSSAKTWTLLTGSSDAISSIKATVAALESQSADEADAGIAVLVDFYGRVRRISRDLSQWNESAARADADQLFAERLLVPEEIAAPVWLKGRGEAQRREAESLHVVHDFQFEDRSRESGITFRNKIVDDAGRLYEAAHYDHGNGLAAADVDGDGRVDLYFLTQAGSNELWRNLGDGKFENITEAAGVGLKGRVSVSASFADVDNDGDPDLFVTTVRHGNVLFENLGGRFRDVTEQAGVGYIGHSSGAVFFDYDRDGRLDLFVANVGRYTQDEVRKVTMEPLRGEPAGDFEYYRALPDAFAGHLKADERNERSILYRNEGDLKFRDVTEETKLVDVCWSGDATPCDFNDDGWPDLYVLNMQGLDEYYENREGKEFVRRSKDLFPNTPWGSMGVKVFDFDNDGRLDLFITDMHSDMSQNVGPEREKRKSQMMWPPRLVQSGEFNPQPGRTAIYGNAFYRNLGEGKFEEISDRIGAETYWPWGVSVGDVNCDGFDDAFVTASMNFPFRYAVNTLLLNDGGKTFRDAEFVLGIEPRRDGRTATPWFELDGAGRDRGHPLCQQHDVTGWRMVWSSLGSKSSVMFDLDGDGDLDIVTNEVNEAPLVLINQFKKAHPEMHSLSVRLKGTKSNRDGLGAIVTVRAGDVTLRKVHDGLSGYLSHSLLPLHFGLGKADSIDSIEVAWPSGIRQQVANPSGNPLLIEEAGEVP